MEKHKKFYLQLIINIIVLLTISFVGDILAHDNIIYTVFPKNFLGIDGSNMTKEKLVEIFRKKNAKYNILIDEPPDLWIGSKCFIGEGLEGFRIKYVVYSLPECGGSNLEIEIELEKSEFKKLLNKLKKILGNYNIGYEPYGEKQYRYFWITSNRINYEGIEEIILKFEPYFIEPKSKQNSMFLFIRWNYLIKDKYAPIHK